MASRRACHCPFECMTSLFSALSFPRRRRKPWPQRYAGPFLASVKTEGIILILPSKLHLSSCHLKKILENRKYRLCSFPENFLVTLLSPGEGKKRLQKMTGDDRRFHGRSRTGKGFEGEKMARLERFELPTLGTGIRCSIRTELQAHRRKEIEPKKNIRSDLTGSRRKHIHLRGRPYSLLIARPVGQ